MGLERYGGISMSFGRCEEKEHESRQVWGRSMRLSRCRECQFHPLWCGENTGVVSLQVWEASDASRPVLPRGG